MCLATALVFLLLLLLLSCFTFLPGAASASQSDFLLQPYMWDLRSIPVQESKYYHWSTMRHGNHPAREASRSHTGHAAYIIRPQIDYCLREGGVLWREELETHTNTHIYTYTQWGWYVQWWVGENGITAMTVALPPLEQRSLCACQCVCERVSVRSILKYWGCTADENCSLSF